MRNDEQIANRIYELSKGLSFSLRNFLKNFGIYEANLARIRQGECNVRPVTRNKMIRALNFLERVFSLKTQMLAAS